MLGNEMNTKLFAAAVAVATTVAAAGAASAATFSFTGGASSPEAGFVVIDDFQTAPSNLTTTGPVQILTATSTLGADPFNAPVELGNSFLSVEQGGSATLTLGDHSNFEFDWGSVDTYNTLVIYSVIGGVTHSYTIIPPHGTLLPPANGIQNIAATNGLFKVTGAKGEVFTKMVLTSSQNSFEIDNVAVSVPEPASWALMIMGFGATGALLRSKRRQAVAA
jgi:hypothetical protein